MSFYVRLSLFAFLLMFVSCGPRNLDRNRKNNKIYSYSNERDLSYVYFKAMSKMLEGYIDIVEEYRDTNSVLNHQIRGYNEVVQLAYKINSQYNKYIENRVLAVEDLAKIKLQVAELKDKEIPDDVKNTLDEIEKKLQDLITENTIIEVEVEVEVKSAQSEGLSEEGDAAEEASEEGDAAEEASEEGDAAEEASEEGDAAEEASEEGGAAEEASEEGGAAEGLSEEGDAAEEPSEE